MAHSPRVSRLRSALLTASPTSYVVLDALDREDAVQVALRVHPGLLVAGLFLTAALVLSRAPLLGRSIASFAGFMLAATSAFVLTHSPALALSALLGLAIGAAWLWYHDPPGKTFEAAEHDGKVGPECFLSLLAWLLVGPVQAASNQGARVAAVIALAVCMILGAHRVLGSSAKPILRWVVTVLLALPPLVSLVAAASDALPPGRAINILAIGPVLLLLWSWTTSQQGEEPSWWATVLEHPARLLVVTFFSLACIGAALLSLPGSSSQAGSVSTLDAIFTAVSAVCVTGLIVLDTPNAWTGSGQAVILALIQLGGLGIMTFYAAALPLLGRRLSMRHERAVAGALSIDDRGRLYGSLGRVLGVTFGCELIGALLLFVGFSAEGATSGTALWKGVFTAVSAFCNAGFALDTESLVGYGGNPLILHTVAGLIIAGGLSPVAVLALPSLFGPKRRTLSLELKLIFLVSALLLLAAATSFAAFEWSASLASMDVADKLHNAWFQAVTLRTAGFNSVDFEETRLATQTMMIFMMFVGGSPGGTAGGIKVTTLAALCLAVVAALQGRSEALAFGRRLHHASVYKAAAITTMGLLSVTAVLIALLLSHTVPLHIAVFEVVSALGTVGLSLGGTAMLDEIGKSLIILCMFAGRVGPLTLFVILVERRYDSAWVYPHEDLHVG